MLVFLTSLTWASKEKSRFAVLLLLLKCRERLLDKDNGFRTRTTGLIERSLDISSHSVMGVSGHLMSRPRTVSRCLDSSQLGRVSSTTDIRGCVGRGVLTLQEASDFPALCCNKVGELLLQSLDPQPSQNLFFLLRKNVTLFLFSCRLLHYSRWSSI